MNAAGYGQMLRGLLPQGDAWRAEPGSHLGNLIDALAEECARIHGRALALIEESDPRTTTELIGEWEKSVGLPGRCAQPQTLEGRRAALVAKVTSNSSPTEARAHFLAALAGYEIVITKYWEPYTCVSYCNALFYSDVWRSVWDVTTESGAEDALLRCLIEDMDPEHTLVRVFFT